jgi:hypothetical protein
VRALGRLGQPRQHFQAFAEVRAGLCVRGALHCPLPGAVPPRHSLARDAGGGVVVSNDFRLCFRLGRELLDHGPGDALVVLLARVSSEL